MAIGEWRRKQPDFYCECELESHRDGHVSHLLVLVQRGPDRGADQQRRDHQDFGTYINYPGFRSGETLLGTDVGLSSDYLFTQTSYATYTIKLAAVPPQLNGVTILGGGRGPFQFAFSNFSGLGFTVHATTNLALPFNTWSNLGPAMESPAGTYTFTDPQATNNVMRFYRVSSP